MVKGAFHMGLRNWEWGGLLWITQLDQCNRRGPYKREAGGLESEGEMG